MIRRESTLIKILAGYTKVCVDGLSFRLYSPSIDDLYDANDVYEDAYAAAKELGGWGDEEALGLLAYKGFWTAKQEEELKLVEEDINKLKMGMFECAFDTPRLDMSRKYLATAKSKLAELTKLRHSYDYLTCHGIATIAKLKYVAGICLRTRDGGRVFQGDGFWRESSGLLSQVMEAAAKHGVDDSVVRDLARNEPWRLYWACKKTDTPLFSLPVVNMSVEQRLLVFWSNIYDSVYESSDCPPDNVIKDDDILDGWFLIQKKKREDAVTKHRLEEGLASNEKIRSAQEVFVLAGSQKDAQNVDILNTGEALRVKQERLAALKRAGSLREDQMPDTQRNLQMKLNDMWFKKQSHGTI